ncbi:MAG: peptide deformylase [Bacteroidales bacterium]|nr:peptide deformylase [Bacteroidales bacterium]
MDITNKEEVAALVQDLKDTLAVADGCGLAAPQIGVSKRVVLVDGRGMVDVYDYLKDFLRVMINPVIIEESETKCQYNEGCLSVPGIYADVIRPDKITVEYYNEDLEKVTETFDKFACRIVQHELSHLDGGMFVDIVAPIRKKIIAKKLQNIAKGKVGTHYRSKIK